MNIFFGDVRSIFVANSDRQTIPYDNCKHYIWSLYNHFFAVAGIQGPIQTGFGIEPSEEPVAKPMGCG